MEQRLTIRAAKGGLQLERGADLPLARLMLGRPVAEVVALLPRLFNLCSCAQGLAARLSAGMVTPDDDNPADLAREIIRDHLMRFWLTLPPLLGLPPAPPPREDVARALFGPDGAMPATGVDLARWAKTPAQGAVLLQALEPVFEQGEAVTTALPRPQGLMRGAYENSPAGRQSDHPLLRSAEARLGRGPVWRLLGMLVDAEAAIAGRLPKPRLRDGVAVVPAARGAYALRLKHRGGVVTAIDRVTPTDHITAAGGALEQALARLSDAARAPLVVALHDPCMPVTVKGLNDA